SDHSHNFDFFYKCFTTINKYNIITEKDIEKFIDCSNNKIKNWMITYLKSCDTQKIHKFIKLVTSLEYNPDGFKIKINVYYSLLNKCYPEICTCYSLINVPNYDNYEEFFEKLDYLVNNLTSFQVA